LSSSAARAPRQLARCAARGGAGPARPPARRCGPRCRAGP
jgi:hypothetical protein